MTLGGKVSLVKSPDFSSYGSRIDSWNRMAAWSDGGSCSMVRPARPAWEISARHAGHLVLAVPLAAGIALIVWKLSVWRTISQALGLVAFLVSFVVFAVAFYSLFEWFWSRPDEIAKKLPISGRELRTKRKQFYDSLPK
jgi:hypothetical protein